MDDIYPNGLGYKEGDTSKEAAQTFAPRARVLRDRALAYISANPGRTADQIAEALGESVLAVRPRISELRKSNLIVNAGRGTNSSGMSAHRWRVATPEEMRERESA
jgi:predicted ArsR family transcriptional regulator